MTVRNSSRPIARVFRATAAPGCRDELLQRFHSSSAALVNSKVGCLKYRILEPVDGLAPEVVFESIWRDLDAVKVAFGDAWQQSHLPEGYSALVTGYSVHHFFISETPTKATPAPAHLDPAPGALSSSRILAKSNGCHVRFGSIATDEVEVTRSRMSASPLKADNLHNISASPLSANNRLMHRSKGPSSITSPAGACSFWLAACGM